MEREIPVVVELLSSHCETSVAISAAPTLSLSPLSVTGFREKETKLNFESIPHSK